MAFKARLATADDAEIVAWHRVRMFQEMGLVPDNLFEQFRGYALDQLRQSLDSGEYIGWLVPAPGNSRKIIAGAGLFIRRVPPFPLRNDDGEIHIAQGRQGLIVNVFTEPKWRRRGLARLLMKEIISWSHRQGIETLVLHASDQGRTLYERLGFIPTNEMRRAGQ